MITEKRLNAPQIAELLFAYRSDEHDVAERLDIASVKNPNQRQQGRKTAGVVADTGREIGTVLLLHSYVGAFGKHSVEMSGDDELWPSLRSLSRCNHVAFAINRGVLEPEFAHASQEIFGANRLLVWRSRDLSDALLLLEGARVVRLDLVQELADARVVPHRLERRVNGPALTPCIGSGKERRERADAQGCQHKCHPHVSPPNRPWIVGLPRPIRSPRLHQ